MDRNTKNLLLSEWHNAYAYLERLFHAGLDLESLNASPKAKGLSQLHGQKLQTTLFAEALLPSWIPKKNKETFEDLKNLRHWMKNADKFLSGFISLSDANDQLIDMVVDFINLTYDCACELHMLITDETDLEVQYPRLNLVEMNPEGMESNLIAMPLRQPPKPAVATEPLQVAKSETVIKRWGPQGLYAIPGDLKDEPLPEALNPDEEELMEDFPVVAHFQLPLQSVYNMQGEALGTLKMLEQQREKKYQQMIHEGHEGIFHKDYPKALEAFQKALNYQESAEILTLIGWVQSLMGQIDKAKAYCLRAIQKDPDYGPPYNDLGSYFLTEGQIDESLKWFEMAKKSLNYQNREYPYINCGRAFMTKKDLPRALDEFSKALTIAPYHEDLHKTVEKLKKSLMRLGPTNPEAPPTH